MDGDTIIPQRTCPRCPLESHLDIHITLIYIVQVVQKEITLGFVQADDGFSHGSINVEGLPASGRVNSYNGVNALNMLGPRVGVTAVQVFVGADINCFSSIDDLAELGTQLGVCCISTSPQSVSTDGRDGVVV